MKRKSVADYFSKKCRSDDLPVPREDSVSASGSVTESDVAVAASASIDLEIESDVAVIDSECEDFCEWMGERTSDDRTESEKATVSEAFSSKFVPPGPSDIASNVKSGPFQPSLKTFPSTKYGQGKDSRWRSFKQEWFSLFPWLEYSTIKNAAFCFPCRFFQTVSTNAAITTFTSTGFSNWKHAMTVDKGLKQHENSIQHKHCQYAWQMFQDNELKNTSVAAQINSGHASLVRENVEYISVIGDALLYTAVQGIAQRGNDEGAESNNRGNFLELLHLISKHNDVVKKKLADGPQNAKYTHSSIQNELLHVMSSMVIEQIRDEVKRARFFAIMVDESKDITKVEQLSIVVRYYLDGSVYERFLGFTSASFLEAEHMLAYIKHTLSDCGIDINCCIGQTYDGSNVMSGRLNGVQALMKRDVPQAMYTHCFNHRLNLVIVDVCKNVKPAANFFALIEDLYMFLSGSATHAKFVEIQKLVQPTGKVIELKRICETRWTCQVSACQAVKRTLSSILVTLTQLSVDRDDRSSRAKGLLNQLNLQFVVHLCMFCKLLQELKGASDYLQGVNCDLVRAIIIIQSVIDHIRDQRAKSEESFHEIWVESMKIAEENNLSLDIEDVVPARAVGARIKRLPQRFQGFIVTDDMGSSENQSNDSEAELRIHVFVPVLDRILGELSKRFEGNAPLLRGITCLSPQSESFMDMDMIKPLAVYYECDLASLESETKLLPRTLKRYVEETKEKIESLLQLVQFLEKYRLAFNEAYKLCTISLTIPASSAACERTFSCMRRVKSYLRNRMGNNRLSALSVLSVEKDIAKGLNMRDVVKKFDGAHQNLRITLH